MAETAIYYHRSGEKGGRPIVLLHGWLLNAEIFFELLSGFSQEYTLYVLEMRGHGKASIVDNSPSVEKIADDLNILLSRENLKDVLLVGHSMGAFVALEYLKKYGRERIASLAMVDMTLKIPCATDWSHGLYGSWREAEIAEFLKILKKNFVEGMVYYSSHGLSGERDPEKLRSLYRNFFLQMIHEHLLNPDAAICLYEDMLTKDYREFFASLTLPILLMHGISSQVYTMRLGQALQGMNPLARLEYFEGSHMLFLEEPELFVRLIEDFYGA